VNKLNSATHLAFIGTVFIGGTNFVAVSFSNLELQPFFGAALRFGLAALIFFLIARVSQVPLPPARSMAGAAVYGLLGFGAAYAFLYYALVGLSAGTTALILASVPLLTLVIAVVLGQERLTLRGVIASILVIVGIAVLSLDTLGGDLTRSYLFAAMLGAIAAAASSVVAKSFRDVHPLNMNAFGMAAGTMLLTVASLAFGERWPLPQQTQTWIALSWLVVLGSVGLFQLFLYVIRRWTASATVYSLAAMPVVAVALGAVLLNQPITIETLLGGSLVVAAVYVGATSGARPVRGVRQDETEVTAKSSVRGSTA
jgi:drug/metabolite transporter (DMT)-like permease